MCLYNYGFFLDNGKSSHIIPNSRTTCDNTTTTSSSSLSGSGEPTANSSGESGEKNKKEKDTLKSPSNLKIKIRKKLKWLNYLD